MSADTKTLIGGIVLAFTLGIVWAAVIFLELSR